MEPEDLTEIPEAPESDEIETIELEPEKPIDGFVDEESRNVVPFYMSTADGKEFLDKLVSKIIKQCDEAVENSEALREERKTVYEVVAGRRKRANGPWEGCADMKTYIALERIHRLVSRLYVEIAGSDPDMFKVLPNGVDQESAEVARILTAHSSWQFREEITDFPTQLSRFIMEAVMQGTAYGRSSRDFMRDRNRHDTKTFDDLIIPFVRVATEVDLSDMPWKAEILNLYDTDIEREEELGNFANLEDLRKVEGSHEDNPIENSARDSMANLVGLMPSDDKKDAPRFFIEYHGWEKLPNLANDEKRSRAICATIEPKTKSIVRLYVREEDNWKDVSRAEQQIKDADSWAQASMEHPQLQAANPSVIVPVPPMPTWMKGNPQSQPDKIRKSPIELFYRADCIPNMADQHGIGFGQILVSIESGANSAYNHFIDSAEMGNDEMLVTAEGTIDKDIVRGPGRNIRLKGIDPTMVDKAFSHLKFSGANPQLMEIVRMSSEYADSAIAAPAVLSGQPGKSGETFRGISTRIEQATRQLTTTGMKIVQGLSQVARNNAFLNAKFMPDEEIFRLAGSSKMQRISRSLYQRDYRVSFTADMRFVGQSQRVAENDELVNMALTVPQLASNPAYMYAVTKAALEARGKDELVRAMGEPPPPPAVPFGTPPAPPPGAMLPGDPNAPPQAPPQQ